MFRKRIAAPIFPVGVHAVIAISDDHFLLG